MTIDRVVIAVYRDRPVVPCALPGGPPVKLNNFHKFNDEFKCACYPRIGIISNLLHSLLKKAVFIRRDETHCRRLRHFSN